MRLNTHIIIRILTVILMTAGLFGGECFAYDWTGNGTSSNPYQLKSLDDWNEFYSNIGSYYNQSIILKTDLDVGARYINYQFWGIFDGNGHTINISLSANYDYAALFKIVNQGTIKNLRVQGTISSSKKCAGGIVGQMSSGTIQNCISSVTINSSVNGDGSHGGILGMAYSGTNIIKDCIFNGELLGSSTNCCGGLVGAGYDMAARCNISNCLFDPKTITMSTTGSATISRCAGTITNCYYKTSFGATNNQGTSASDMNATQLAAGLNTGAASGKEPWVAHNGILYLKPFDQYVDITGWVVGKYNAAKNAPVYHGGYGGSPIGYYYTPNSSNGADNPPTTAGYYYYSYHPQAGTDSNNDYWWTWDTEGVPAASTKMYFCVVNPPTPTSTGYYNYNDQPLLDTPVNSEKGTPYYKIGTDGTWATGIPTAKNAGTYRVYYYVKGDENHNDIAGDDYYVDATIAPRVVNSQNNLKIVVPDVVYTGSALTPTGFCLNTYRYG